MTYARCRLWLGIGGVGSIVVVTLVAFLADLPPSIFSTAHEWSVSDLTSLFLFECLCIAGMLPLDLMGGFVMPRVFGRQSNSFADFFRRWSTGVMLQASLFSAVGLLIVSTGRFGGRFAVLFLIAFVACGLLALQRWVGIWMTSGRLFESEAKVARAMDLTSQWGMKPLPAVVVAHTDPGFTGGVVGLPYFETLVLPGSWVDQLSPD